MANENLLFRKGLQNKLKDLPITPGAISFTIDEPGMYIDLPANTALGHSEDYRVRIGDVITVYGLEDLANKATIVPGDLSDESESSTNTLAQKINKYSASALYYVINYNMLLKYNPDSQNFIWINNTSTLEKNLAALSGTVQTVSDRLNALTTKVGNAKSSSNAATGLYAYVDSADKALQDQINALTGTSGGSGVSLASLDAALKKEISDRETADDTLGESINTISGRFNNYSTTTEMNAAINTAKTELTTAIGTAKSEAISSANSHTNAEIAKIDTAYQAADDELKQSINTLNGSLSNYAKKSDVYDKNAIDTKVSDLEGQIAQAKTDANSYTDGEITRIDAAYKLADSGLETKINTVSNTLSTSYYNKTAIDTKVDDLTTAIGTAKSEAITSATGTAKSYTDAEIAKVKTAYEEADSVLETKINTVSNNLSKNYYNKTEIDTTVETLNGNIDAAQTSAVGTANAYTDAEIAKIDTAYQAADAALKADLESKINGINGGMANYYDKTEIDSKVSDINTAISTAQTNATTAAKTYTDGEIGKVTTAYQSADTALKNELDGKISVVSSNLSSNYYTKSQVYTKAQVDSQLDSHLQEAKDYVDGVLDAAQAMEYKGEVTGASDTALQNALAAKTNVEAGHVYVITSLTNTYRPGDLMIAAVDGDSANSGKLAWSTSNWHHVKTGYDVNLEQVLKTTVDTSTAKNGGKVELDAIGSTDTGSITFKAASDENGYTSSARVSMALNTAGNTKNSTVTFGMVWTDF